MEARGASFLIDGTRLGSHACPAYSLGPSEANVYLRLSLALLPITPFNYVNYSYTSQVRVRFMCVVIYIDWYQLLPVRPISSELPREMGSRATSGRAGKAQSHVRREQDI